MSDSYKQTRKQKQKEIKAQPVLSGAGERLKTIVRRLPPNLPEDIFWQSVQAWVTDETVSWKAYYPGKFRTKRMNKEGVPSRAYIAFKTEEQVATFSREYDGHVFRDKAGNESHAIVEFSPFQKTPTEKKKADARNNTIDKDDDYRSFLEALDAAKSESGTVPLETLLAASQPLPPPTTTPLLEALKAERSAQKDKEAILRNHAHYKDAGKKEEGKKKSPTVVVPKVDLPAPSKKGKKDKERERVKGGPRAHEGAGPKTVPTTPSRPRSSKHPKGDPPVAALPAKPGPASPVPASASAPAPVLLVPPSTPNPAAVVTTDTPPQRKHRPVLGLGRHFETALSGAVAKKRGEDSTVPMSLLQREVVIMQRPASPKEQVGEGPSASPATPSAHGAGPGRGPRRGRGRGRGHRGG